MESNGKFTLIVFNTCTQEYEEVIVTEEVYRTYCRTRWNIKDNDQSFFDHEIQTSGMIGSQDGAYENFREFIDAINTPEHIILEQIKKEALYQAISALPAADQALVQGLFFKGQSELDYSTLLPQAGRQLELCGRTSRESHPSGERPELRTGVSLWADGIMAGTACQSCLGLSGYRSAPYLAVL